MPVSPHPRGHGHCRARAGSAYPACLPPGRLARAPHNVPLTTVRQRNRAELAELNTTVVNVALPAGAGSSAVAAVNAPPEPGPAPAAASFRRARRQPALDGTTERRAPPFSPATPPPPGRLYPGPIAGKNG